LTSVIYASLAVLFLYKALQELGSDPTWSIIYVLVGLEYALEGGHGKPRSHN